MQYLISYDISDKKIRNKVVTYLESFSYRVQYSVFMTPRTRLNIKHIVQNLERIISGIEKAKILIITISDSVKEPVWSNEKLQVMEYKVLII